MTSWPPCRDIRRFRILIGSWRCFNNHYINGAGKKTAILLFRVLMLRFMCCGECWVICSKICPSRTIIERALVNCQCAAAVLDGYHGNTLSLFCFGRESAKNPSIWIWAVTGNEVIPNLHYVSPFDLTLGFTAVQHTTPGSHSKLSCSDLSFIVG